MENNQGKYTVVGTNIDEVKKQNANSGLTYNELNEWFAKKLKAGDTKIFTNNQMEKTKK